MSNSLLGHIVYKRFSHQSEDVATDALAYVVSSSDAAREAFVGILRQVAPQLPDLHFRTQQAEGAARPDMCGMDGRTPRAYVEAKFWAGLTDNQPVSYLQLLAERSQPTVLLFVVPVARTETVWRELLRRVCKAGLVLEGGEEITGTLRSVRVANGPHLALTTWPAVLDAIQVQTRAEPGVAADLAQLRALCSQADSQAFLPFSEFDLTDERIPRLLLQLNTVIDDVIALATDSAVLSTSGLRATHTKSSTGRYVSFPATQNAGAFFGIDLVLWREYGVTPLWLVFPNSAWGRAAEVRPLLEPWARRVGLFCAMHEGALAVGIRVTAHEEREHVSRAIVELLGDLANELKALPPKPT